MNLIEAFRIAWTSLMLNKVRALLTMLGIIIGVGAVVGMLAIGNGLSNYLEREFNKLGIGVFYLNPQLDGAEPDSRQRPQLTYEDALAITQPGAAPLVQQVAIEFGDFGVVGAGSDRFFYQVTAITPNNFTITENTLLAGRYYTNDEEQRRERVAVLGTGVVNNLFSSSKDAIGKRVTINDVPFQVIGVVDVNASQASRSFNSPADTVFVPYQTGRSRLFRNQLTNRVDVGRITVQATRREDVPAAIEQVRSLLRSRHRLGSSAAGDFTIQNPEEQARQAQLSIVGLNVFLSIIAGISLLVGGIGVMNIMLVSVTQRTREIGLRKAVGARRRDILQQFLIEAVVLCLLGCGIGVGVGYLMSFGGTYVLQNIFRAQGSQAVVSMSSIILATSVSTIIGLFFGFYPALRAARMRPIQALRSE